MYVDISLHLVASKNWTGWKPLKAMGVKVIYALLSVHIVASATRARAHTHAHGYPKFISLTTAALARSLALRQRGGQHSPAVNLQRLYIEVQRYVSEDHNFCV